MAPTDQSTPSRLAGRLTPRVAGLLAVVPLVAFGLWHLRAPLDISVGDQAQYLLHAARMLDGRDYTDIGYIYFPGTMISPAAYPPGLPLLLALVQGLGGSLLAMRLLMLAGAAVFFYVAARYLSSREDAWLGPAAVFVCGFVPQLGLFASAIYTDFIFGALVWGCCLLADRPGRWSARRVAGLCVLGLLAIAFRTIGVALIPALVLHQGWRSWRHHEPWVRAVLPATVWLVTFVAIESLLPVSSGYARQITSVVHESPTAPGPLDLVMVMVDRLLDYRRLLSELQLTPTSWRAGNTLYHLAALVLLAIGSIAWVRRAGVRFLLLFLVCYGGMILLIWPLGRFLWPILPAIWFATLEGVRQLAVRATSSQGRAVRVSVASAAIIAVAAWRLGPPPPPLIGVGDVPEGQELYRALAGEAQRAPVRTLFYSPRDAARMPGISAMAIPNVAPDSMLDMLHEYRITHAVLGSLNEAPTYDRRLAATIDSHPARFRKVHESHRFALFRVLPTGTLVPAERSRPSGR